MPHVKGARDIVSVVLVEDHDLYRLSLKLSLEASGQVRVVAETTSGKDAIRLARETSAQIFLMDLTLPELSGLKATREIKDRSDKKVIILTSSSDEISVLSALKAGADGFLSKDTKTEDLLLSIYCVASGASWLDDTIAGKVAAKVILNQDLLNLDDQSASIIGMVRSGMPVSLIAQELCLPLAHVHEKLMNVLKRAGEDSNMENLAGVDEGDCLEKEITPVIICTHCRAQVDGSNVCPSDGCAVSADPFIGTQLNDRYIITSRIGAGGHGTVYRGKHRITGRHVAIKILHRDLARKHDQFNRFRQEAVALSSLDHRNLITIHDFGVTGDGLAYMIMDLLEGSSLVEIVKNNGPLPYRQALPVFREICAGVDRAHQSGIIHRDLKPGNVFISKTEHKGGRVKVLDFGLAKVEGKARVALTSPGEVFGSPAYMSPEQCRAESLDIRSDIYSMGCLMHQVLTGKPVFTADSAPELMYLHMFEEAKPCRAHNPDIDVPVVLEMVILKCLEKLPKERFQSMTELEAALSNCSV